jgi:hypothetical protein
MNKEQMSSLAKIELLESILYKSYQKHFYFRFVMFWVCSFALLSITIWILGLWIFRDHSGLWFFSGALSSILLCVVLLTSNHIIASIIENYFDKIKLRSVISIISPYRDFIRLNADNMPDAYELINKWEESTEDNIVSIYKKKKIDVYSLTRSVSLVLQSLNSLKIQISNENSSYKRPKSLRKPVEMDYPNSTTYAIYVLLIGTIFMGSYLDKDSYGWAASQPASEEQKLEVLEMMQTPKSDVLIQIIKESIKDGSQLTLSEFKKIKEVFNKKDDWSPQHNSLDSLDKIRQKILYIEMEKSNIKDKKEIDTILNKVED